MIDRDELRRLCAQRPPLTLQQIADRFGVSYSGIRLIIARNGISRNPVRGARPHDVLPCPIPGARYIPLGKGKLALVDEADYAWLKQWKWWRQGRYAARGVGNRKILLHRVIMDAPEGMEVDHINGDGLDNRRCNLRLCTHTQNLCNSGKRPGKNLYKGVEYNRTAGLWAARIRADGKRLHLGYYRTPEAAAAAYNEAALKYHGEFARLNQIPSLTT